MSVDIIDLLRDRAYGSKVPDPRLAEAADEIERLRSLTRFQDGVIRSGNTATLTTVEQNAVLAMACYCDTRTGVEWIMYAAALRGLLERLT